MPGYTPPPGAAVPPAGGGIPPAGGGIPPAGDTPGGAAGGAGGEGSSPGFLPESPNPLDTPTPGAGSDYPYGSSYQDTWASRRNHTPSSPTPAAGGNSLTHATGNGIDGRGNGASNTGNGITPNGTRHQSAPPAKDENPIKRWWHNLTHHQPQRVERMEAESDPPPPASGERGEKARGAQEFVSCTLVRHTEVTPGKRVGYPNGTVPDKRLAGTDLGLSLIHI